MGLWAVAQLAAGGKSVSVRFFHEVVGDHVAHGHVGIFDPAHVGVGNMEMELSEGAEFAAVAAGHGDGFAAHGVGCFDAAEDVGGVARTADGEEHVAGFGEVLELLGEDDVVADIVGVGRESGQVVVKAEDAELLVAAEAGTFQDIADEVGSGAGAASVAADEDGVAGFTGFGEKGDRFANAAGVDAADGFG